MSTLVSASSQGGFTLFSWFCCGQPSRNFAKRSEVLLAFLACWHLVDFVDRWHIAIVFQNLSGEGPNQYPPLGVDLGTGTLHLRGVCCSVWRPSGPITLCGGPPFRKLSGGKWIATGPAPRFACCLPVAGLAFLVCPFLLASFCPLSGGLSCVVS